jgi:hypothetical protein
MPSQIIEIMDTLPGLEIIAEHGRCEQLASAQIPKSILELD